MAMAGNAAGSAARFEPPAGFPRHVPAVLALLFVALRVVAETPADALHLGALELLTAEGARVALAWLGLPLQRQGTLLSHAEGFVAEIHIHCTVLIPALLLAAGLLLHRGATWGERLAGIALGTAFLALVNQIRIMAVITTGVHGPAAFDIVDLGIAPALLVAAAVGYAVAWSRRCSCSRTLRPRTPRAAEAAPDQHAQRLQCREPG